jgi:hypothetical protein
MPEFGERREAAERARLEPAISAALGRMRRESDVSNLVIEPELRAFAAADDE